MTRHLKRAARVALAVQYAVLMGCLDVVEAWRAEQ